MQSTTASNGRLSTCLTITVGNAQFVAAYDALMPHTFRFVNDGDVVTGVPKFRYMPGLREFRYKVRQRLEGRGLRKRRIKDRYSSQ